MHYYLYEIKNKVNNKVYVGVHKTKKLCDGYMGSGTTIRAAIKKYGIENFEKRILASFPDAESMYLAEEMYVDELFLSRDDVYNLRRGGLGGFDHINDGSKDHLVRCSAAGSKAKAMKKGVHSPDFKSNQGVAIDTKLRDLGTKAAQTVEAKEKRAKTRKETNFQKKQNNSQYGTTWVWHELIGNKKISKDLLPEYIDQGWTKRYIPGYRIESIIRLNSGL